MSPEPPNRAHLDADTLVWQGRIRLAVAAVVGVAAYILVQVGGDVRPLWPVVLALIAYVLVMGAVTVVAAVRGQIGAWGVTVTVLADVAYLFAVTILASSPAYLGRVLILSFVVLHLTDLYFGRTQALVVLVSVVLGYLVTVSYAINHQAALTWAEELWSVAAFALVGATYFMVYGSWHRRLAYIARLLDRAEEGEFAAPYDLESDAHPDAVTMVGIAYNRVREQISSMVLTDPLTGCVNRRGFDQELARELARATRAGSEFSLLALDLDYFKTINDTRGHIAGDAVLREIGALLKQLRRTGDVVARTGGEEFAIILPDTSPSGAHQVATRLVEAVRTNAFLSGENPVHVTVSIGVVSRTADLQGDVVEEIKRRADIALYEAKRKGRDRVWVWTAALASHRLGARITDARWMHSP
ncbi:MAG TPA: GGDEF domain-containing protein [Gemmatimonadaceae bacterium]|nr:GGDEF domain-containing protein [Gemmatimonadaceae bacterium]